jgi:hypothetical protein
VGSMNSGLRPLNSGTVASMSWISGRALFRAARWEKLPRK